MRKLSIFSMLALALLVSGVRAADKPSADKAEAVKVEGKTACAHCEYGLDEVGCALAIKDKAGKIFVLKGEGEDFKAFVKSRSDNKTVKIEGNKVGDKKFNDIAYTIIKVSKIEEVK